MTRRGAEPRGWWTRRRCAPPTATWTTATCWTGTPPRCRTRGPAASPRASTRSSRTFDPAATRGRTASGAARSSRAPSSTSCTWAPSRRRAPWTPRSGSSTTWSELGIDFVELLPVNGFNGTHNWGYDGVLWYAVHEGYGGPAAYQRFVDAAHAAGLGVIQDVVYNHLGPSGNYLPALRPVPASRGRATPGATRSTWTARTPTRCAATSWTTPRCGCATTTWTACGWTPCTRFKDERAVHLLEDFGALGRRRRRRDRPPGHDDRRIGPEQPAADLPAGRQRLRAGRAVER